MTNKISFLESFLDNNKARYYNIEKKLNKCGFSPNRCSRAIAATGITNERVAGEWLTSHIDDPELDKESGAQDYYIFLCPNESLTNSILDYWQQCYQKCGWNYAHDYPPHITLLPQFQIGDKDILAMYENIINCFRTFDISYTVDKLEELVTSDHNDTKKNFLGYQVTGSSKLALEKLSKDFLENLDKVGLQMNSTIRNNRKGIYHLSLAYGFSPNQCEILVKIMHQMSLSAVMNGNNNNNNTWFHKWNLCLYTCDVRVKSIEELYEMQHDSELCPHQSTLKEKESSQLLLHNSGDLIGILDPSATNGSIDAGKTRLGWRLGLNLMTGLTGLFLSECGTRVPYHRAWTLHFQIPLTHRSQEDVPPIIVNPAASVQCSGESTSVSKSNKSTKKVSALQDTKFLRRFIIMRHGERVDFCFRDWISKCFDDKGTYHRHNLNMPLLLPARKPSNYFHDSPLTQLGCHVAHETGLAMKVAGVHLTACYSSPSFRCIQTASSCLRGLEQESIGIKIEPLLFEWMGWYKSQSPSFFSPTQLYNEGYPVIRNYNALSKISDLQSNETTIQYYERKGKLFKKILEENKKKGSSILIVAHAASLDVCARAVLSSSHLSDTDFHTRANQVPFCAMVQAIERSVTPLSPSAHYSILPTRWNLIDPPSFPFSHTKSVEFNWKDLFSN